MGHIYNPSTGEVEAGGSESEGHPWHHSKFEVSMGHTGQNELWATIMPPTRQVRKMPGRCKVQGLASAITRVTCHDVDIPLCDAEPPIYRDVCPCLLLPAAIFARPTCFLAEPSLPMYDLQLKLALSDQLHLHHTLLR